MVNDIAKIALTDRHVHVIDEHLGLRILTHGPPRNPSCESIKDDGQRREACPGRDVRDVGSPEHDWAVGAEVAVNQIGGLAYTAIADRRTTAPTKTSTGKTCRFPKTLDTLSADMHAAFGPFSLDAWRAITISGGCMDLAYQLGQSLIGSIPRRRFSGLPSIEFASKGVLRSRHGLDW